MKNLYSDTACEALRAGKRLRLLFQGYSQIAEVHSVGVSVDGYPVMHVYQISGSETGSWRIVRFDELEGVQQTDEVSDAPRAEYDPEAKRIAFVRCRI